jgi:GntR family transcriptional regulator
MNGVPLHSQIRASVQELIETGEWPARFRLPSEAELALTFKVSRMTVRQAIDKLVESGLLYRRRGVGTFVVPRVVSRDLMKLSSFSEDAKARGMPVRSEVRVAKVVRADTELAKKVGLLPKENVVMVERLRFYDDRPIALQKVWVPEALCPELVDPAVAAGSIYGHLELERNYRLGWGLQTMSARVPTKNEARLLQIASTSVALMCVERTTFLDDGTAIELSRSIYRGDEETFTLTLKRWP